MFALLEVLLVPLSWYIGVTFANYFEARRPKKLLALIFAIASSFVVFPIFVVIRFYVGSLILNDPSLGIKVDWFGPLDPPVFIFIMIFAYGGSVSFYSKSKE
jgi:hypothetical protein